MIVAASFGPADGGILAAVFVLVAVSAMLALAETSLVRMSRARARALVEQHPRRGRALADLVADPEGFLAPVLLLVLVCQLVAATLVGVVAARLFGPIGVLAATVFEVVFIFVAAEAVPKQWAVRHADRAALFAAPIIAGVIAFPPVRLVAGALTGISHLVIRVLGWGDGAPEPDVTESELLALADVAVEADVIEREERALLSSIIEFGDTIVREVMAPRPDVVAVEASTAVGDVLERAIESGLSRIPVYERTVDDITGIALTRDLIRAARSGGESEPVAKLARPARYVPETKRVAPLLREMQAEQNHIVVVVDEYGGTAGIVTLEDLIEELVGEIADEFDLDEPEVEVLGDGGYRVSGRTPVDEVNELVGADLPAGDWDTVAGLVFHLRGQVPTEGEVIRLGDYDLVAEQVKGRRIGRVRIERSASAEHDHDAQTMGRSA